MKTRISRLAMVLLVIVALLGAWTAQGRTSSRAVWEYAVYSDSDLFRKDLNSLGAEGWELVAILPSLSDGTSRSGTAFYFKRPK
ncbi:MAG TPA: hypothetical protein VFB82_16430 [Blastocatellia bacterium]|nr:hypothetical protein [Blastocatellia bacterium]